MRGIGFLVALALVTLPLAGCLEAGDDDGPGAGDARELEARTLAQGQGSAWTVRVEAVIETADRWTAWWAEHDPSRGPAPEVDFGEERVLALVLGNRPDTCHEVEITRVLHDPEANRVLVTAVEHGPAPGEGCGDAITQPHHVVAVPDTGLPVEWDVQLWTPPGDDAREDVQYRVLAGPVTNRSYPFEDAARTAGDADAWQALWDAEREWFPELPPEAPPVDFTAHRAAVLVASKPDPCHAAEVANATASEGALLFEVRTWVPHDGPQGCPTVVEYVAFFVEIALEPTDVRVERTLEHGEAAPSGGETPPKPTPGPVEWALLARDGQSGIRENRSVIVDSDAAWAALWENHTSHVTPPPERPVVDFTAHRVLAVFMGERPSTCYSVNVTGVHVPEDQWPTVVVNVTWTNPPPESMCGSAMSAPVVMITLPAGDADVVIDGRARSAPAA